MPKSVHILIPSASRPAVGSPGRFKQSQVVPVGLGEHSRGDQTNHSLHAVAFMSWDSAFGAMQLLDKISIMLYVITLFIHSAYIQRARWASMFVCIYEGNSNSRGQKQRLLLR